MTYQLIILGIAIHALFWEHLPHWGSWFNTGLSKLPKPLQSLYEQWNCPFCAGFWIGLMLHAVTGQWTFPMLGDLPAYWGPIGGVVGWFLDGLATAILIKTGVLAMWAIGLPAMLGHKMKAEFMKTLPGT